MSEDPFLSLVEESLKEPDSMKDVKILETNGGKRLAVIVKGDPPNVFVLGCEICILPSMVRFQEDGEVLVSGRKGLPLSSISENDSLDPIMQLVKLCPDCGRPLINHSKSRSGILVERLGNADI